MAEITADRVLETSTTTGTGAFTLAGAIAGHQRFSDVCSTSDTVYYSIWAVDGNGNPSGDWETGLGTYSAANTLTRTTPADSSNAGSAVNFSAGTKHVALSVTAGKLSGLGGGGGAYTLVQSASPSAVSSIDLEDFAGGGYDSLHIEFNGHASTAGSVLTMLLKHNGSYVSSSHKMTAVLRASAGGSTSIGSNAATEAVYVGGGSYGVSTVYQLESGATEGFSVIVDIPFPEDTTRPKKVMWNATWEMDNGNLSRSYGGSQYDGTDYLTAIDGVRWQIDSGTFDGEIRIWARS